MNFKGLIMLVALGIIIFSYVQIKKNNPLSQDRLTEAKEKHATQGRYN